MLYTKGLLSAAAGITEQSASGKAIGVDELHKVMNSSASDEQKTSFFIQYLLSQREWLLDFAKTLLIAVIVFVIVIILSHANSSQFNYANFVIASISSSLISFDAFCKAFHLLFISIYLSFTLFCASITASGD